MDRLIERDIGFVLFFPYAKNLPVHSLSAPFSPHWSIKVLPSPNNRDNDLAEHLTPYIFDVY